MRANKVRERWEKGEAAVSACVSIGAPYGAEIAGWSGADCVLVDLQHGILDLKDAIGALQAISATPAAPFARAPSCDPPLLMKLLDAGAYGLICPMVNRVSEAKAFVSATRYPPRGSRSFGPARGLLYGGPDYFDRADETIIRLAMIETAEGLDAVEYICAVDGLDGLFIGPNDLALALGYPPSSDPSDAEVVAAIERCLRATRGAGKHTGIFCPSGAVAARRAQQGFDFLVPNSDANLLKSAMALEISAARAYKPIFKGA
jgi:4-hydroxy-2-oxoheptanedioate aldolase